MRTKICPICAAVSGTWLLLQALILAGYLNAGIFMPMILLLMGGTVVGIADRFQKQKPFIIGIGMILAYLAAQNLNLVTLGLEIAAIAVIGYFLFFKPDAESAGKRPESELEKKLKDCC